MAETDDSGPLVQCRSSADNAQQLCAYETVSLGFSHWCSLFTYEEWQGFGYGLDIAFAGGYGFRPPTGRAKE